MNLRPYQSAAVDAVFAAWETVDSTLLVLPTGTGKTVVFSHVIARRPKGKALVLAHREELIFQGADKIEAVTGVKPGIEMAEFRARTATPTGWGEDGVVVSSVQTQNAGRGELRRMQRFNPDDFSVLIVDEAHHTPAVTYRRVVNHFRQNPRLKILGVTATPDRHDEQALGKVFGSACFDYKLPDAIRDGWLAPIRQRAVHVEGLDYSKVRTTAGDLNGADLKRVLADEDMVHRMVSPTVELIGPRKTLIFCQNVAQGERTAEVFNRYRAECARFVHGKTPKEDRRRLIKEFAEGKFQILVNVGVATEGFDDPSIEVVVIARPTKSRALYAQMVGRGTRVLPECLIDVAADAAGRRARIAASRKPFVEIIDFTGNSGRHRLVTTADILGGHYDDAVVAKARKKVEDAAGGAVDVEQAIAEAAAEREAERAREAAKRAHLTFKAFYKTTVLDPFARYGLEPWVDRAWNVGRKPTPKQLRYLEEAFGVRTDKVQTFTQATQLIDYHTRRRDAGLCSDHDAGLLVQFGYSPDMPAGEARRILAALRANNWRRLDAPPVPPPKVYT